MRSLTLESPAKVNLTLHVLGRRKDGYHEILTLFHRISLKDRLRVKKKPSEGIRIFCSHPRVPKKTNLIVRAFHLLKERYFFQGGVTVRLSKRIPVGGGLGGGSSNAASFLIAMNRLFRLRLSLKQMICLGKRLGSDVPFFIFQTSHAIGRGRGDQVKAIPFRRRLWFLLISRGKGISTRRVYEGLSLSQNHHSLTRISQGVKMISNFLERGEIDRADRLLVNDLSASAERIQPSLKKVRERLRGLQLGSFQMSGSGPTLFSIFSSRRDALQALRRLQGRQRKPRNVFICHSF